MTHYILPHHLFAFIVVITKKICCCTSTAKLFIQYCTYLRNPRWEQEAYYTTALIIPWSCCTTRQPQATLFKILIGVGTNEFLKRLGLHWGTLYRLPEGKTSYSGVEDMRGIRRCSLCLSENRSLIYWLEWLVLIAPHNLHASLCQLGFNCAERLPYLADISYQML